MFPKEERINQELVFERVFDGCDVAIRDLRFHPGAKRSFEDDLLRSPVS